MNPFKTNAWGDAYHEGMKFDAADQQFYNKLHHISSSSFSIRCGRKEINTKIDAVNMSSKRSTWPTGCTNMTYARMQIAEIEAPED